MRSRTAEEETMAITVKPRHPALGAEIRGVDMKKPLDAETVKQVHDAWMKHLVVVFPDQQITDQEHVAFTRNFGEAEIFHQTSLHLRSDRVREIFLVSNVDEQNKLLKPSDPGQKQLSSSQQWHTDSSYRPVPSHGLAAARHRDQPHRRHHPVHQHVHGLRRAAGKPEAPGRGPQGAARFRHAEPAGRLDAADRRGEGRHAAGVASHGAASIPSRAASASTSARSTTMPSRAWKREPRAG